jgi:hypothetical protein
MDMSDAADEIASDQKEDHAGTPEPSGGMGHSYTVSLAGHKVHFSGCAPERIARRAH